MELGLVKSGGSTDALLHSTGNGPATTERGPDQPQSAAEGISKTMAQEMKTVLNEGGDGNRLYVGNLAYKTTPSDLSGFFSKYDIKHIDIPHNPKKSRSVGYGFVTLGSRIESDRAISELSGQDLNGRTVSVQNANRPIQESTEQTLAPADAKKDGKAVLANAVPDVAKKANTETRAPAKKGGKPHVDKVLKSHGDPDPSSLRGKTTEIKSDHNIHQRLTNFSYKGVVYSLPQKFLALKPHLRARHLQFDESFVSEFLSSNSAHVFTIDPQVVLTAYKTLVDQNTSTSDEKAAVVHSPESATLQQIYEKVVNDAQAREQGKRQNKRPPSAKSQVNKDRKSKHSNQQIQKPGPPEISGSEDRKSSDGSLYEPTLNSSGECTPPAMSTQNPCEICRSADHQHVDCPKRVCDICGAIDDHFPSACPQSALCTKCRQRGHSRLSCPEKLAMTATEGIICDLCGAPDHLENRCDQIWRTFTPTEAEGTSRAPLPVSCFSCGGEGHTGKECALRRKQSHNEPPMVAAPRQPPLPAPPRNGNASQPLKRNVPAHPNQFRHKRRK